MCKCDFRKDAVYTCFANSISMTLHKAFDVIQSNVRMLQPRWLAG